MRQRLALHGRNHRHGGADPIPYMLQWGQNTDDDSRGLNLEAHDDVLVTSRTDITLQSQDGASIFVDKPLFLVATGGTTEATINIGITPGNFLLVRDVSTTTEYLRVGSAGTDVKLRSGGKFRVMDTAFSVIFEVDEDGTITPTPGGGGTTVATDTIWDAKGDLAAGTGADTAAKLTVGSNDQVLIADSSQTTGLKWGGIDGGSA